MPKKNAPSLLHTSVQQDGIVTLCNPNANHPHWGVVRVSGNDAQDFLQRQLTNDIAKLKEHSCLAAWCDAKGRMLASMLVLHNPANKDEFLLLLRHNLIALILKRLTMFILRSNVLLEDVSADYLIHGALGSVAQNIWQSDANSVTMNDWSCVHNAKDSYIALPNKRVLILQTNNDENSTLNNYPLLEVTDWLWAEIASGVVMLEHNSSGLYTPQMLNYEIVGGVDFKKGCYPGQEVIARTQFLGKIKRRGYIATASAITNLCVGDSVWCVSKDKPNNAFECGAIVQTALNHETLTIFVVLQTSALEQYLDQKAVISSEPEAKHELQLYPLPYAIS